MMTFTPKWEQMSSALQRPFKETANGRSGSATWSGTVALRVWWFFWTEAGDVAGLSHDSCGDGRPEPAHRCQRAGLSMNV